MGKMLAGFGSAGCGQAADSAKGSKAACGIDYSTVRARSRQPNDLARVIQLAGGLFRILQLLAQLGKLRFEGGTVGSGLAALLCKQGIHVFAQQVDVGTVAVPAPG
jgi:hypothetical protein